MGYDLLAVPVPYVTGPMVSVDGWSVIHILTFVGCAALVPGRFWWLMLLGAVWEVYENAAAGGSWLFLVGSSLSRQVAAREQQSVRRDSKARLVEDNPSLCHVRTLFAFGTTSTTVSSL